MHYRLVPGDVVFTRLGYSSQNRLLVDSPLEVGQRMDGLTGHPTTSDGRSRLLSCIPLRSTGCFSCPSFVTTSYW